MATFYRMRARVTSLGVTALFTYYWDSTGGTPAAIATEAGARVRAFWASFAARIPNTATVVTDGFGDEVDEATGQIVGAFAGAAPANLNGTGAGDLLPNQTQGLLRYTTGSIINGRRVVGRQFIPFAQETDNTGGLPVGAYTSALQTAANLLGTTVVTPIAQRVWHRPGPSGAGLSVVVTGRTPASSWAVLRSRR